MILTFLTKRDKSKIDVPKADARRGNFALMSAFATIKNISGNTMIVNYTSENIAFLMKMLPFFCIIPHKNSMICEIAFLRKKGVLRNAKRFSYRKEMVQPPKGLHHFCI